LAQEGEEEPDYEEPTGPKIIDPGTGLPISVHVPQEIKILSPDGSMGAVFAGAMKKAEALKANNASGKKAEVLAKPDLEKEGNVVLGSQVTVRTSVGNRVVDHLIRTPNGEIVAVEVKSGLAKRSTNQLTKDRAMEVSGTPVGKNAPGDLRGTTIQINTIERHYP